MLPWQLGVVVLLVGLLDTAVGGPLCHECSRIPIPRDCDKVIQCGDHESCYVNTYISSSGHQYYDLGCQDALQCGFKRREMEVQEDTGDVIICEQCCQGDFCNTEGCGAQPLPPLTERGPMCFTCHQQRTHNSCEQLSVCRPIEQCFLTPSLHGSVDLIHESGCMSHLQCEGLLNAMPSIPVGKRQADNTCTACCSEDYCNRNCTSARLHSPYVPRRTTASTRHTTTRGSTQTTSPTTTASSTTATTTTTTTTATTTTTTPTTTSTTSTTTYPTVVHSIPSDKCTSMGYLHAFNLCYKLYNHSQLTWTQARDVCHKDGGDLVQFQSAHQREYLEKLLQGGSLPVSTGYWVGAGDAAREGQWTWLDGSPVSPYHFHPGQPDNGTEREDCGLLVWGDDNKIMLGDADCDLHEHFICQMKLTDPVHRNVTCRNDDYTYYDKGNVCYKVYTHDLETFDAARIVCQRHAGDLLMLANIDAEHYFTVLHELVHGTDRRFWLGGMNHGIGKFHWLNGQYMKRWEYTWNHAEPSKEQHQNCLTLAVKTHRTFALSDDDCYQKIPFICEDHRIDHRYWLGATNWRSGGYEWLNGQPVGQHEYIWLRGEPNNFHGNEHCLTLTIFSDKNLYALNDDNCNEKKYFICEEKCPNASYLYLPHLGLCIKKYNQHLTWPNARMQCLHDNADLVVLDTPEKLAYYQQVSTQAADKTRERYWIGASDSTNNGVHDFNWVNGDHLPSTEYTLWHTGEPSHSTARENCVALWWYNTDSTLKFNDASCLGETMRFICQIDNKW